MISNIQFQQVSTLAKNKNDESVLGFWKTDKYQITVIAGNSIYAHIRSLQTGALHVAEVDKDLSSRFCDRVATAKVLQKHFYPIVVVSNDIPIRIEFCVRGLGGMNRNGVEEEKRDSVGNDLSPPNQVLQAAPEGFDLLIERLQFEQELASWVQNPEAEGNKIAAAKRILEAFDTKAKELTLKNLRLTQLPKSALGSLPRLHRLDLSGNYLASFSVKTGSFLRLKWLDLSNNALTTFSVARGSLVNLCQLDLSNNCLRALSVEFVTLGRCCGYALVTKNNFLSMQAHIAFQRILDQSRRENPYLRLDWEMNELENLDFFADEAKTAFPMVNTDFYHEILPHFSDNDQKIFTVYLRKMREKEAYRNAGTRNEVIENVHTILEGINKTPSLGVQLLRKIKSIKTAEIPFEFPPVSPEQWAAASTMNLPPYPQTLVDFLDGDCTIWLGQQRWETHIVVPLFSQISINGEGSIPLTLESLELLNKSSGGPGYRYFWGEIPKNIPAEKEFHYAVMTNDVIPGSRNKPYKEQIKLLPAGYEAPGVLDAARAIFWENRRSGKLYFNCDPWTSTRCKEVIQGGNLVVGGFAPSGLDVHHYYYCDYERIGVAGWRKF